MLSFLAFPARHRAFDGNCFLTKRSWEGIKAGIERHGHRTKYFVVPMARLQSNDQLLDPSFEPPAHDEFQIIFRRDAQERYNENMRYGHRDKVSSARSCGRFCSPWQCRMPSAEA